VRGPAQGEQRVFSQRSRVKSNNLPKHLKNSTENETNFFRANYV
jgi:hypothetical protein